LFFSRRRVRRFWDIGVKITAAIIALLLAFGFIGYTKTGARILNSFGLASACDTGCS
jgi:hypothetical protein